jgi:hypothetical protein
MHGYGTLIRGHWRGDHFTTRNPAPLLDDVVDGLVERARFVDVLPDSTVARDFHTTEHSVYIG